MEKEKITFEQIVIGILLNFDTSFTSKEATDFKTKQLLHDY